MPYGFNDDKSKYDLDTLINGVRGVEQGGTGASTAAAARASLGVSYANATVLFDNDSNSSVNIVLEDSAANYEKLVICYRTNMNQFSSVEVWHPNNKTVSLGFVTTFSDNNVWFKHLEVNINGENVNAVGTRHQASINASGVVYYEVVDTVFVTQVIGYKA